MILQKTYGLHDTEINEISVTDEGIELFFDGGVYRLDGCGKETTLTQKCSLLIAIRDFDRNDLFGHIEIVLHENKRVKEITLMRLRDMLKDAGPIILDLDFYSYFSDAMLLKGHIGKNKIEITVSEIEKTEFLFGEGEVDEKTYQ